VKYHAITDAAEKLGGVPKIRELFMGFRSICMKTLLLKLNLLDIKSYIRPPKYHDSDFQRYVAITNYFKRWQ